MSGIAFAPASVIAVEIQARRIGALELYDHYSARIERENPALNAVVVRQIEKGRERARKADAALAQGEVWGPLHGVPGTIKEAFDVEGAPTTFGNPFFKDNIARADAAAVERVLAAGAVILGKTNVPLMLADHQSHNDIYGTTSNPWDRARTPGGSSGGSAAAVASGLAAFDLGSDIAGSIRVPAHFCGVYGHKPSFGLVPYTGHAPPGRLTGADMAVAGPLARDAGDLALALGVMAGPDGYQRALWKAALAPPRATRLADFRVAVWRNSRCCEVDDAVLDVFDAAVAAVREAGARVDDAARPDFDEGDAYRTYLTLVYAAMAARTPLEPDEFRRQREVAESLGADDFSSQGRAARGATLHHGEWLAANEARARIRRAWRDFFDRFDVVLAPTASTTAFRHDPRPDRDARTVEVNGRSARYWDQIFWAGLASLPYLPATAAPIGIATDGLPVGLQIIGPEGDDLTTIELARALAAETGRGFVRPPQYRD
jgi:amidase